jgi:hypothetical protein
MRESDELMDLRAERMALLQLLNSSSNAKRQAINKRLTRVSKKIQRLSAVAIPIATRDEV